MARNRYLQLSVTRSASRYAHYEHKKSFVLHALSLHTMQYFLGKYFEAHAKCNNWKVIAGYQC